MNDQNQENQYEDFPFNDSSFINVSSLHSPSSCASHWHTYGEFILCVSPGEPIFTVSSETYLINENDLLMVWPCELHSIETAPQGSLLIVQFPGPMLSCTSELHMLQDFLTHRHLLSAKDHPEQSEKAAELLFRIRDLSSSSEPFRDTKKQICLMKLLLLLGQDFSFPSATEPETVPSRHNTRVLQKLSRACAYISQNCEKNLTLEDAASYTGFSKYHFSRIFKEYMNTSFTAYLTSQRIQKAISLFTQPELSITDAVFLSGFGSVASFNRSFKQQMGCTPSEYRSKMISHSKEVFHMECSKSNQKKDEKKLPKL